MNVVELSVSGNDKQETRSGSNILNFNVSQNSKVIVNNDGTITINGTGGFSLNFEQITLKSGVTYYEKFELISGSITGSNFFLSFNGTTWLSKNNFINYTPTEDTNKSSLWIHQDAVFENAVIKLWANTDQSEFEAYGAMPSPLYPSEVETVNTQASVVVSNKNILNFEEKSTSWNGSTITVAGNKIKFVGAEDGSSGLSYSSNRQKVDLRKGTTLTYSSKYVSGVLTAGNTYYHLYGVNNKNEAKKIIDMSRTGATNYKTDKQATYMLEEDIKEIYISGSTYNVSGLTEELIYEFQLEIGDTATEIIEHTEQTKVVDIQQEMLEGDYFVKEADGWKEVHLWGKYTFTGNESFSLGNTYQDKYRRFSMAYNASLNVKASWNEIGAKSNYFTGIANKDYGTAQNNVWINEQSRFNIGIDIAYLTEDSANGLKAWLAQKHTEGNPVYCWYKLETPIKLACTEIQSAQLDDLLNTSTYKNVTHIYSTDKVSPIIKVVYRKDTPTLLNNIYKLIVENGGN